MSGAMGELARALEGRVEESYRRARAIRKMQTLLEECLEELSASGLVRVFADEEKTTVSLRLTGFGVGGPQLKVYFDPVQYCDTEVLANVGWAFDKAGAVISYWGSVLFDEHDNLYLSSAVSRGDERLPFDEENVGKVILEMVERNAK